MYPGFGSHKDDVFSFSFCDACIHVFRLRTIIARDYVTCVVLRLGNEVAPHSLRLVPFVLVLFQISFWLVLKIKIGCVFRNTSYCNELLLSEKAVIDVIERVFSILQSNHSNQCCIRLESINAKGKKAKCHSLALHYSYISQHS